MHWFCCEGCWDPYCGLLVVKVCTSMTRLLPNTPMGFTTIMVSPGAALGCDVTRLMRPVMGLVMCHVIPLEQHPACFRASCGTPVFEGRASCSGHRQAMQLAFLNIFGFVNICIIEVKPGAQVVMWKNGGLRAYSGYFLAMWKGVIGFQTWGTVRSESNVKPTLLCQLHWRGVINAASISREIRHHRWSGDYYL